LAAERNKARERNDWVLSDQIRLQIERLGFAVKDTQRGSEVVKKA